MFCEHCGNQIENDSKYCKWCGHPQKHVKTIQPQNEQRDPFIHSVPAYSYAGIPPESFVCIPVKSSTSIPAEKETPETVYKFCVHCGSNQVQSNLSCSACGKENPKYDPEATSTFCPSCGNSIPLGAKYCPLCGEKNREYQPFNPEKSRMGFVYASPEVMSGKEVDMAPVYASTKPLAGMPTLPPIKPSEQQLLKDRPDWTETNTVYASPEWMNQNNKKSGLFKKLFKRND